jgi:hypothetical protein
MNKRDIIIVIATAFFLSVRLYQKYQKKKSNSSKSDKNISSGSGLPYSAKDDEYEPYSKK